MSHFSLLNCSFSINPRTYKTLTQSVQFAMRSAMGFSCDSACKNLPAMWVMWVRFLVGKIPWRRERLPTPVFWPGEFHGLYTPWGYKESDTTEQLSLSSAMYRYHCHQSLPRTICTLFLKTIKLDSCFSLYLKNIS